MQKNIHYLILYTCIYSAWSSADMRPIRSFVQGNMPVVAGLVIGHHVGSCLGAQRSGPLAGACMGIVLDHYFLKGHKDRHAVARNMGNVMPVVLAAAYYYGQEVHLNDQVNVPRLAIADQSSSIRVVTQPDQQVSSYDMLRMYVFNVQDRNQDESFNDFHPKKTAASLQALIRHIQSIEQQKDGSIRVGIIMGRTPIICPIDQSLAQELLAIWSNQ